MIGIKIKGERLKIRLRIPNGKLSKEIRRLVDEGMSDFNEVYRVAKDNGVENYKVKEIRK
jgi:hypothetical protein